MFCKISFCLWIWLIAWAKLQDPSKFAVVAAPVAADSGAAPNATAKVEEKKEEEEEDSDEDMALNLFDWVVW